MSWDHNKFGQVFYHGRDGERPNAVAEHVVPEREAARAVGGQHVRFEAGDVILHARGRRLNVYVLSDSTAACRGWGNQCSFASFKYYLNCFHR